MEVVYSLNDELRAFRHRETRGVENQVVLVRFRRVLLEMIANERDVLAICGMDKSLRFFEAFAVLPAYDGDTIVDRRDQANAQRSRRVQNLGGASPQNYALPVGAQR